MAIILIRNKLINIQNIQNKQHPYIYKLWHVSNITKMYLSLVMYNIYLYTKIYKLIPVYKHGYDQLYN